MPAYIYVLLHSEQSRIFDVERFWINRCQAKYAHSFVAVFRELILIVNTVGVIEAS